MRVNAVFEGGGVKGIALAGAVRAAEQHGVRFERVAGTSSGSIVASLIASGFTASEMKKIIIETPFSSLLTRAPVFNVKVIGPVARVLLKKGLYSGEALEYWIRNILLRKKVRTFGDLGKNKLRIIASDITNGKLLVLPDDISQYGIDPAQFEVAKAIRMSTSIPYFFDPVMIREAHSVGGRKKFKTQFAYIVDGGLLSNFPLWLFDRECKPGQTPIVPTIGFQLVGKTERQPHRIAGPFSMFEAMFETMMSAHDERYIEQHNRYRTIKVPTLGIGTVQFDISTEESLKLYDAGLAAGTHFFEGWTVKDYEVHFNKYVSTLKV